jgi:hypothetical protein
MMQDAKSAGIYENKARGIKCERIRIVQVEELVHGAARLDLPLNLDATVKARRDAEGDQLKLDLRPPTPEPSQPAKKAVAAAHHQKQPARVKRGN